MLLRTPLDELSTFIREILSHIIVSHKLLKSEAVKAATAEVKKRGYTQQNDGDREVNVKPVRDEWNNIHMPHNLKTIQK